MPASISEPAARVRVRALTDALADASRWMPRGVLRAGRAVIAELATRD